MSNVSLEIKKTANPIAEDLEKMPRIFLKDEMYYVKEKGEYGRYLHKNGSLCLGTMIDNHGRKTFGGWYDSRKSAQLAIRQYKGGG